MEISDRMKSYELKDRLPKGAVIIRVDGKAFHTWTKAIKADKPFDGVVHVCMLAATRALMKEAQGARLGYTQSDESSVLLTNLGENEGGWFDYKVQKLASVSASIFTLAFARAYESFYITHGYPNIPALFDARVYSVPVEDAANVFVWRQQDWERNSVQMLGHFYLGHKRMQNMKKKEVLDALSQKGIDWQYLDGWKKYGSFVIPRAEEDDPKSLLTLSTYMRYFEVNHVAGLDKYLKE